MDKIFLSAKVVASQIKQHSKVRQAFSSGLNGECKPEQVALSSIKDLFS